MDHPSATWKSQKYSEELLLNFGWLFFYELVISLSEILKKKNLFALFMKWNTRKYVLFLNRLIVTMYEECLYESAWIRSIISYFRNVSMLGYLWLVNWGKRTRLFRYIEWDCVMDIRGKSQAEFNTCLSVDSLHSLCRQQKISKICGKQMHAS